MSSLLRARAAAREAGAAALAVIVDPGFPADRFGDLAAASRTAETTAVGALESDDIAVFVMTDAAFRRIAAREGGPAPTPQRAPVRFEKPSAHFAAQLRLIHDGRPPNVVAVLPGSDPALRDEYVILSAHMDHVGVGEAVEGDSIYNGADDDASGTSALVEVAEALAMLPEAPRRSVVFLHVSGEEHGLLGSGWFSEHPTVPLDRVVANVNVDMIGRNGPDSVVVIGKNYSSLGAVANAVQARHPELGLTLSDDIWPEERFFFRSDHFNFARKEIPSLFFFSGVHEDYHQPSDEVESLDVDKAARISRMIFHIVREIADAPARPAWDPAGLAEVRALTGN
jgi:Zn-dependent M28 family amino/carboxypeptidase